MASRNTVTRFDLRLNIDLPAHAPAGCPHLIDINAITELEIPDDLTLVDAIVTLLFKWDARCLQDLLDLSREDFYCSHITSQHSEYYVKRDGRHVTIGMQAPDNVWPDHELQYYIQDDGCWHMIGGQRLKQQITKGRISTHPHSVLPGAYRGYDNAFAEHIILLGLWERSLGTTFRWEVDGTNMMVEAGFCAGGQRDGFDEPSEGSLSSSLVDLETLLSDIIGNDAPTDVEDADTSEGTFDLLSPSPEPAEHMTSSQSRPDRSIMSPTPPTSPPNAKKRVLVDDDDDDDDCPLVPSSHLQKVNRAKKIKKTEDQRARHRRRKKPY